MRLLLFIPLTLMIFVSCKKASTPLSRQDELRGGSWRTASATYKYKRSSGKDTTINYFDLLADCREDDYLVFETNFTGLQKSGDKKCSAGDPDEVPFGWELVNNDAGINFYNANMMFDSSTIFANFVNYSPTRFTIRYVDYKPHPGNASITDTFTYTRTFVK
jgi:hypothetical protein